MTSCERDDAVVAADRMLAGDPEVEVEILRRAQLACEATDPFDDVGPVEDRPLAPEWEVRTKHVGIGVSVQTRLVPSPFLGVDTDRIATLVHQLLVSINEGALGARTKQPNRRFDCVRAQLVVGIEKK